MNATSDQTDDIIKLMIEAHDKSPLKEVKYDVGLAKDNLNHWINNPFSLVLVNSSVTACYVVALTPSWWTSKQFASDIFFYSKTPGAGFRLMKEAQAWVDNWGEFIAGEHISTSNADPAVDAMYQRMGYQTIGFQYRRGNKL